MAADLMQSFIGKHVEKAVLAAAGLVFLGSVVWFGVMREPQDRVRGQVKRLVDEVKAKTPTLDDALTKDERVSLGIDSAVGTASQFGKMLNGLPAEWDAVARMVEAPPKQSEAVVIVEQCRVPSGSWPSRTCRPSGVGASRRTRSPWRWRNSRPSPAPSATSFGPDASAGST